MATDDLLRSISFAAIPVAAFGLLLVAGVGMDLWADMVAAHKATQGRPWLLFRRKLRRKLTDAQRN